MTGAGTAAPQRNPTGRKFLLAVLISLGALLIFLGSFGMWARLVLLNTDEWVETAEQVQDDPEIRAAVTQYALDELEEVVDLDSLPIDSLPEQVQSLAGPMSELSRNYLAGVIDGILSSDQFGTIWVGANEQAHTAFVAVVRDQSDVVAVEQGKIVLDLHGLLEQVKADTAASGASFLADVSIPEDVGQLTIAEDDQIDVVSNGIDLLDTTAPLIVLAGIVLFAVAVLVSKVRWKTLVTVGAVAAGLAAVIMLSLAISSRVIDAFVVDDVYSDASTSLFGIATRQLRTECYVLLFLALVLVGAGIAVRSMGRRSATDDGSIDPTAVFATSLPSVPPSAPPPSGSPAGSPPGPPPGRPSSPPPSGPRPPPAYPPGS